MKRLLVKVLLVSCLVCNARAGVLPPDAVLDGRTIAEWSVEWWKWIYPCPTNRHPWFDTSGAFANTSQPDGPVFFVAGALGAGSWQRSFRVPEDKYLLLPLLNSFANNVGVDPPFPIEVLRDWIAPSPPELTELHASLDGVPLTNLFAYAAIAPLFSVELTTADNIESWFAAGNPVSGLVDPMLTGGYWLLLEPLPVGRHVLNFGGAFTNGSWVFWLDVADTITVVQVSLAQQVGNLLGRVRKAGISQNHLKPLVNPLEAAQAAFVSGELRPGIKKLEEFQKKLRPEVEKEDPALAKGFYQTAQRIIAAARRDLP